MPVRAPGTTSVALAGLFAIAVATRVWFLDGPQLDYDEGVYWQSLRALAAGHPLFTAVYSSQPPGFLLALAPFYDILGHSLGAARAGVVAFSLAGIGAAYLAVAAFAGPRAGVAAAALLVADPVYLRQSVTLQADGPALALALVALAVGAQASRSGRRGGVAAFSAGALFVAACLVKLLALPAALPLAMLLWPSRRRILAATAGGVVAGGAILAPFAGALPLVLSQSVGLHLAGAGSLGGFGGLAGTLAWEIPLALLASAAILLSKDRRELLLPVGWVLAAAAALLVVRPLWAHHLVALTVPLAILAAPAVEAHVLTRAHVAGAGLAILLGVAGGAWMVASQQIPANAALAVRLREVVPAGREVITDDQFGAALAGRDTPPELVDTSYVRVISGDLRAPRVEAIAVRDRVPAIVFATGRLVRIPGLASWAAEAYPRREAFGSATILEAP